MATAAPAAPAAPGPVGSAAPPQAPASAPAAAPDTKVVLRPIPPKTPKLPGVLDDGPEDATTRAPDPRARDAAGRFVAAADGETPVVTKPRPSTTDAETSVPEPPEAKPKFKFAGKEYESPEAAEHEYKSLTGKLVPVQRKLAETEGTLVKAAESARGWHSEAQRLAARVAELEAGGGNPTPAADKTSPEPAKGIDWELYAEISKVANEAGTPWKAQQWLQEQVDAQRAADIAALREEAIENPRREAERQAQLKSTADTLVDSMAATRIQTGAQRSRSSATVPPPAKSARCGSRSGSTPCLHSPREARLRPSRSTGWHAVWTALLPPRLPHLLRPRNPQSRPARQPKLPQRLRGVVLWLRLRSVRGTWTRRWPDSWRGSRTRNSFAQAWVSSCRCPTRIMQTRRHTTKRIGGRSSLVPVTGRISSVTVSPRRRSRYWSAHKPPARFAAGRLCGMARSSPNLMSTTITRREKSVSFCVVDATLVWGRSMTIPQSCFAGLSTS